MVSLSLLASITACATALALPQAIGNHIKNLGDAAEQCDNREQISCCNKDNSAGTLLDGLLGGNCTPLDLSVLAIDVPISTACSNQVACCIGDQNGLLSLACTNLIL